MKRACSLKVDVWIWSLYDVAEAKRVQSFLTEDEVGNTEQFHKAADRLAFIVRRGRMREILASQVNLAPNELRFAYGPDGKPSLCNGPEFSLSHSAGHALLALTESGPIGVDLEAVKPLKADLRQILTEDERATINAFPDAKRQIETFRLWTRKEALSKAMGIGVWLSPETFSIGLKDGNPTILEMTNDDPEKWALIDLERDIGMPSTLAMRADGRPVRVCFNR